MLASKAVELLLDDIKKNGDKEIYCGFPTNLGFGVQSIRPIKDIKNGAVFGKPVTYIELI